MYMCNPFALAPFAYVDPPDASNPRNFSNMSPYVACPYSCVHAAETKELKEGEKSARERKNALWSDVDI